MTGLVDAATSGPWLAADGRTFARDFDRAPFVFEHRLTDHPLFAPERLLRLAAQMAREPGDVYYDVGEARIGTRWDQMAPSDLPIDEVLHRIETAGAWVILRRAEKDPEYAQILRGCIDEIEALCGRKLAPSIKLRNAIVFLNSPHRVSSYHIDRECNCLLQIRGTKSISIFDRNDREILPEDEIERFWTVDNNAAVYKPQFEARGTTYDLSPGSAVHIPVNAPHYVKNGPEVSVSLSINFHYHDALLADVYRANHWLRRIGFQPLPPRRSRAVDAVKGLTYSSARRVKSAAQRLISSVPS